MDKYTKIINGFVAQTFEKQDNGNFICTYQDFIASDEVRREIDGEYVEVDISMESYQNMEMISPAGGDSIDDRWSIKDVQRRYKDEDDEDDNDKEPLSDEVARRILKLCSSEHDANDGINWGVIDMWTRRVLNPNDEINN